MSHMIQIQMSPADHLYGAGTSDSHLCVLSDNARGRLGSTYLISTLFGIYVIDGVFHV